MKCSDKKAWEKTFDAIDDWICIIDLDARILRSNLVAEKLFQMKIQDIVGQKCCTLAHGSDTPVQDCPLPKMIETGKRAICELQLKDGPWVYVTVDPLVDDHGKLTGAVHIARDITQRIEYQNERERLIGDLENALAQVKRLSGLIPICGNCKKIRDDKGYWNQIDAYIEDHSEAKFSHGLCQDCADTLYADQDWYQDMKKDK